MSENARGHNVEGLLRGVESLFESAKYTDILIECRHRKWKVHKAVICQQSAFFAKACDGGFIEAQQNVITLKDDQPGPVHAMLQFMYTGNYGTTETSMQNGLFSIKVRAMADKYDVLGLAELAEANFIGWAADHWMEASFAKVVLEIYTNDTVDHDGRLRDAIFKVTVRHAQCLLTYRRHLEFREAIASIPEFMMALALELATRLGGIRPLIVTGDAARQVYLSICDQAGWGGVSAETIAEVTGLELREVGIAVNELDQARLIVKSKDGRFDMVQPRSGWEEDEPWPAE
ncbi:hypothetical protein LTR08_003264 [Meristemomyces frigidus]|nr:hypothetical protein LTR08_003264 [Meristemomyces frigidus]